MLTTALIVIPFGGALAPLAPAVADERLGRRLRAPRRARRARALGRHARQLRLRAGAPGERRAGLVLRPRRLLQGRALRLVALARRPDRARLGRRARLRALGRAHEATRLLRAHALPRGSDDRRVRRPGSPALLRLLRGDADPALRADRRLGRRRAARRDDQVHRLHDGGLAPDARRHHRARARGGLLRHVEPRAASTTSGSSSGSWPRSSSRRRSSRSTAGCPTRTARRPPRSRRCSRESSPRRPRTGSCGSSCRPSRSPSRTGERRCSSSPRSGSCTARCSHSARPTCGA